MRRGNHVPLVVALGFFALAAQTLLFRDFFAVFEGNELGVGAFFASWLMWIALGGLAGRWDSRVCRALTRRFPLTALLYVPAFAVQHTLVLHARTLIGVAAYELFPFAPMMAMALVVNAPVSFLTGFLFTRACPWTADAGALPVARVYILETLGSCLGAVVSTALLARGVPGESVFLCAACVLGAASAAAIAAGSTRRDFLLSATLLAIVIVVIVLTPAAGLGRRWAEVNAKAEWTRLLPAENYQGSFTTAQGRYLYGERQGQFVVMTAGGACESLPPGEHDAEVAALHLAQKPDARDVLVFGEASLGVCMTLKRVPQIGNVAWLHPDPEYPRALMQLSAVRGQIGDRAIEIPEEDIRNLARAGGNRYDLIVLNLPDITTLVRNRYCTIEFFALLKNFLRDGGVVSARVSGGANYMGGELAVLNASMLATIQAVFKHNAIKPGDETWILASDAEGLSESPGVLQDRYAGVAGAAAVYPPQGVFALYPPDRIAFQRRVFAETRARTGADFLRNTDLFPKAPFFSILLALKQAGWGSLMSGALLLYLAGLSLFAIPILAYGAVRFAYILRSPREGAMPGIVDAHVLVFSTGFAGMAASIVFFFLYQVHYGSLFLDIGILTALFMLGSSLGALTGERILARGHDDHRRVLYLLGACLAVHVILLSLALLHTMMVRDVPERALRIAYAFPFLLCGAFTGVYFPIAAKWMALAGRSVTASGSNLETVDNFGGAAGALIAGLALLPVLGNSQSLVVLGIVVAVNFLPLILRGRPLPGIGDGFDRRVRPAGYALFGIGLLAMLISQRLESGREQLQGNQLLAAVIEMIPGAESLVREQSARATDGSAPYFKVDASGETQAGYVFETRHWTPPIYGYGGQIDLAAYVDENGNLLEYRLIRSKETPSYVNMLSGWKNSVLGRNLFDPDPFADVDAVSGATLTSNAVLKALETAGRAFAVQALGKRDLAPRQAPAARRNPLTDPAVRDVVLLAALAMAVLLLRYRPRTWPRRATLLIAFLVFGFWLNLQYSTQQIMSLLSFNIGSIGLNATFFLAVGVPVIVLLFGNVYCGYLCPFGAIQELVGDLRHGEDLDKGVWRYGRAVKYVLLFAFVLAYAATRDYAVLQADPLVTFFGLLRDPTSIALGGICVVSSLWFKRFWCRNLCPAGAFLSLLNGVRLFRRIIPARQIQRCDLGVRTVRDLDCIYCDRCLMPNRVQPVQRQSFNVRQAFLAAAALGALFVLGLTLSSVAPLISGSGPGTFQAVTGSAGKARDVDVERVKRLIDQRGLSGHEAEFYGPVSEPGTEPTVATPPTGERSPQ